MTLLTGSHLSSHIRTKTFHCHCFTSLSRWKADFSRLLSHHSDRCESFPTRTFEVSELTEQTLLLTKCWTERDGEKSYCQISTVEVTASPHLCCEFKVKIDSSPYVAIYSFYQPMTFIVTNKGIVSSTALDGSLHWVTRFHSGGT